MERTENFKKRKNSVDSDSNHSSLDLSKSQKTRKLDASPHKSGVSSPKDLHSKNTTSISDAIVAGAITPSGSGEKSPLIRALKQNKNISEIQLGLVNKRLEEYCKNLESYQPKDIDLDNGSGQSDGDITKEHLNELNEKMMANNEWIQQKKLEVQAQAATYFQEQADSVEDFMKLDKLDQLYKRVDDFVKKQKEFDDNIKLTKENYELPTITASDTSTSRKENTNKLVHEIMSARVKEQEEIYKELEQKLGDLVGGNQQKMDISTTAAVSRETEINSSLSDVSETDLLIGDETESQQFDTNDLTAEELKDKSIPDTFIDLQEALKSAEQLPDQDDDLKKIIAKAKKLIANHEEALKKLEAKEEELSGPQEERFKKRKEQYEDDLSELKKLNLNDEDFQKRHAKLQQDFDKQTLEWGDEFEQKIQPEYLKYCNELEKSVQALQDANPNHQQDSSDTYSDGVVSEASVEIPRDDVIDQGHSKLQKLVERTKELLATDHEAIKGAYEVINGYHKFKDNIYKIQGINQLEELKSDKILEQMAAISKLRNAFKDLTGQFPEDVYKDLENPPREEAVQDSIEKALKASLKEYIQETRKPGSIVIDSRISKEQASVHIKEIWYTLQGNDDTQKAEQLENIANDYNIKEIWKHIRNIRGGREGNEDISSSIREVSTLFDKWKQGKQDLLGELGTLQLRLSGQLGATEDYIDVISECKHLDESALMRGLAERNITEEHFSNIHQEANNKSNEVRTYLENIGQMDSKTLDYFHSALNNLNQKLRKLVRQFHKSLKKELIMTSIEKSCFNYFLKRIFDQ